MKLAHYIRLLGLNGILALGILSIAHADNGPQIDMSGVNPTIYTGSTANLPGEACLCSASPVALTDYTNQPGKGTGGGDATKGGM